MLPVAPSEINRHVSNGLQRRVKKSKTLALLCVLTCLPPGCLCTEVRFKVQLQAVGHWNLFYFAGGLKRSVQTQTLQSSVVRLSLKIPNKSIVTFHMPVNTCLGSVSSVMGRRHLPRREGNMALNFPASL